MADVLAIVEQREGKIRGVSSETVTVAAEIAGALGCAAHALVVGGAGVSGAAQDLGRFGAEKVLAAEVDALSGYHPQGYSQVIQQAIQAGGYDVVVFAATAQGKDLAPRVAALLDVPLAGDITGFRVEGGAVADSTGLRREGLRLHGVRSVASHGEHSAQRVSSPGGPGYWRLGNLHP